MKQLVSLPIIISIDNVYKNKNWIISILSIPTDVSDV